MTETTNSNSDLLKLENEFFTKQSQNKSLLITKSAQKNGITRPETTGPLKTEMISSQVLNKAKQFLSQTKEEQPLTQKCDLIDDESDDVEDDQQLIEMNFLLFENKKTSNGESSEDSSEDSDSDTTEESESDDSVHETDDK